jgi:hypothetical protein
MIRLLAVSLLVLSSCATMKPADPAKASPFREWHRTGEKAAFPLTVALVPFEYTGTDRKQAAASQRVYATLCGHLSLSDDILLVSESQLSYLLTEIKPDRTTKFDDAAALRIGNACNADIVAMGSVAFYELQVYLFLNIVKPRTGDIIGGILEQGPTIADLPAMTDRAARKLFEVMKNE